MKELISYWTKLMLVLMGVAIAMAVLVSCDKQGPKFNAPLFTNLGDYWFESTSQSGDAKKFFVQGLMMSYGFNHAESIRSFKEAIRLDSTYAMAYWGLAYALGPNYNAGMDPEAREEVLWAVEKASQSSTEQNLTDWEADLITSATIKYSKESNGPDLQGYADYLDELVEKYPSNADILTFSAEAKMNLHPWDLYEYKGGAARTWTPQILELLNAAITIDAEHPMANHLLIHATEASATPRDGTDAADRLMELVPGSGHLVHMPSHTYINTGDYHLGTLANEQAVLVDSTYVAQCRAQGAYPQLYYPHNYHFLAACAALEGRGARAIEASYTMSDIIDRNYLGKPGYETTQHFLTIPYNVLVKFAQWEKILALRAPDPDYPYLTAMWIYSRGMALINSGKMNLAKQELQKLIEIRDTGILKTIGIFDINTAQDVTDIASRVLAAEIADKKGDFSAAELLLKEAIKIEDALNYNEPPDWFFSVRHLLGDLYMRNDRFTEAEAVYQEDLKNYPKNGFALNGLYHSLMNQSKKGEADQVLAQFNEAWQYADSKLKYSRMDEAKRLNLALNYRPEGPKDLIYLAGKFCGL